MAVAFIVVLAGCSENTCLIPPPGGSDRTGEIALFGGRVLTPELGSVLFLESADIDGDGVVDVAVTDGSILSILYGSASGGFGDPVAIWSEQSRDEPTVCDLDGHAPLDLLVRDAGGEIVALVGNDRDSFEALEVGMSGYDPAVGDYDGDGLADVACGFNGDLMVARGLGDGVFDEAEMIDSEAVVEVLMPTDIDRDGFDDLLVGAYDALAIRVYLGSADGLTYSTRGLSHVGRVHSMAVVNANGDDMPDILVIGVRDLQGVVSVYLGDGQGGFGEPVVTALDQSNWSSVSPAEINADGVVDLVVAAGSEGNGYDPGTVFLGRGDGSFAYHGELNTHVTLDMEVLDSDRDGLMDVMASTADGIVVYAGIGGGKFRTHSTVASFPSSTASMKGLYSGDLNGDGTPDLVVVDGRLGLVILLGRGSGEFDEQDPISLTLPYRELLVADFTQDEVPDLLVVHANSPLVSLLRGMGDGSFASLGTAELPGNLSEAAAADFDGDGIEELVGLIDGDVSLFRSDGAGEFSLSAERLTGRPCSSLQTGDFDDDGATDILAVTYELILLPGDGNGGFGDAIVSVPSELLYSNIRRPIVADMDVDGVDDLVFAGSYQSVTVMLGQAGGRFQLRGSFYAGLMWPEYLAVADMDMDGRPDVVAQSGMYSVSVLQGIGDGNLAPPSTWHLCSGIRGIVVADVNGDSAPDISGAGYMDGDVSILVNISEY